MIGFSIPEILFEKHFNIYSKFQLIKNKDAIQNAFDFINYIPQFKNEKTCFALYSYKKTIYMKCFNPKYAFFSIKKE